MYKILSVCILFSLNINADIGCASSIMESRDECFEDILQVKSDLKEREDTLTNRVNITKDLDIVKVIYQKKEFLIERIASSENDSCPPNCIQAMSIGDVKTIGELETLEFISSLGDKKDRVLIDARAVKEHMKSTIPSAINIPHILLNPKNRYRDEVLQLLGAKKLKNRWHFNKVHTILIFDNGILDNQATKIIESLIDIGYPQNKIFYYRGGINSWKELGLTLL